MDILSMIQDANRFILYNRHVIENWPLQVYVSALVFCPTMSRIRILLQDERPQWISTSPLVDENWSLCLQILEGHTSSVTSLRTGGGWRPARLGRPHGTDLGRRDGSATADAGGPHMSFDTIIQF